MSERSHLVLELVNYRGEKAVPAGALRKLFSLSARVAAGMPAMAQSVEQFFANRQLTLIVGNAAGSGYDVIGRMVARHMGKYLPGRSTFVVRNMPGAGGI